MALYINQCGIAVEERLVRELMAVLQCDVARCLAVVKELCCLYYSFAAELFVEGIFKTGESI